MKHLQRCVCILILLNCATLFNCECYSSESYRCDLNGEVFDPQCIHKSRVCDGHEDCNNKSDESRCSNGLSAGATTGLIVGGIFGGVMLIGLVLCLVSTYVPGCPGYEEDRGHGHWVRYGHNRRQWVWDVPYEERPWWGQICRKRPPASNLTSLYSIPQPASPTPPSDMDIHSNPGSGDASATTAYQESQGPSRHVQDPESQIPSEPPPSYDEIQFVSRPKRAVDRVEADINERFA